MLKIEVARDIGFCFGVKHAVEIVEKLLLSGEDVYVTGDLIHNENEMFRLRSIGLKSFDVFDEWPDISESTVVIRAHGVPLDILRELRKRAKKVVNATCRVVSAVGDLIKKEKAEGFEIFLYGREGHAEVEYLKSVVGDLKVLNQKNPNVAFSSEKIALFSQTTMGVDGFKETAKKFLDVGKNFSSFHVYNTICAVTLEREKEVKELARSNDLCLVVGGKKSSNTKKLYEIAKSLNENTYMILNVSEIDEKWFKSIESVGICSGTSTPMRIIDEIKKRLSEFKN